MAVFILIYWLREFPLTAVANPFELMLYCITKSVLADSVSKIRAQLELGPKILGGPEKVPTFEN